MIAQPAHLNGSRASDRSSEQPVRPQQPAPSPTDNATVEAYLDPHLSFFEAARAARLSPAALQRWSADHAKWLDEIEAAITRRDRLLTAANRHKAIAACVMTLDTHAHDETHTPVGYDLKSMELRRRQRETAGRAARFLARGCGLPAPRAPGRSRGRPRGPNRKASSHAPRAASPNGRITFGPHSPARCSEERFQRAPATVTEHAAASALTATSPSLQPDISLPEGAPAPVAPTNGPSHRNGRATNAPTAATMISAAQPALSSHPLPVPSPTARSPEPRPAPVIPHPLPILVPAQESARCQKPP
jgi:hypothetical protein